MYITLPHEQKWLHFPPHTSQVPEVAHLDSQAVDRRFLQENSFTCMLNVSDLKMSL